MGKCILAREGCQVGEVFVLKKIDVVDVNADHAHLDLDREVDKELRDRAERWFVFQTILSAHAS